MQIHLRPEAKPRGLPLAGGFPPLRLDESGEALLRIILYQDALAGGARAAVGGLLTHHRLRGPVRHAPEQTMGATIGLVNLSIFQRKRLVNPEIASTLRFEIDTPVPAVAKRQVGHRRFEPGGEQYPKGREHQLITERGATVMTQGRPFLRIGNQRKWAWRIGPADQGLGQRFQVRVRVHAPSGKLRLRRGVAVAVPLTQP